RTVEARLLYDLQTACVDHEREIYALDIIEWALSGGKRPIKRPLPRQRIVRITRHLRTATQRLPQARISDADRQHLTGLLGAALQQSEEQLRDSFRPVLADAFNDVGLSASSPPEQTALKKMTEELLDRITSQGFLTFSDLRDGISRNQLKMPDVGDAQEFVRGDPLIRLDRRLGGQLDGVYRPGEVYLRGLQRTTSLAFGTGFGRTLTRYVFVPFGGAFLAMEGLELLVAPYLPHVGVDITFYPLWTWFPLGLFLLGLLHWPRMRRGVGEAVRAVGRGLKKVFYDAPRWLM